MNKEEKLKVLIESNTSSIPVFILDDGKQKHQSFEAWIVDKDGYEIDIIHIGYGNFKEEAIENLKKNIKEHMDYLEKIDFSNTIFVDLEGNKAL